MKKVINFFRMLGAAFCPHCNSDAPMIDNCPVCKNDRTSPFGWKRREEILKRYDLFKKDPVQLFMNDTGAWSDATFGSGRNPVNILNHLKLEVPEVIEAIEDFHHKNICTLTECEYDKYTIDVLYEYADCFILLLDSARCCGISFEEILEFSNKKLEINKRRQWNKPDENGVCTHKK